VKVLSNFFTLHPPVFPIIHQALSPVMPFLLVCTGKPLCFVEKIVVSSEKIYRFFQKESLDLPKSSLTSCPKKFIIETINYSRK